MGGGSTLGETKLQRGRERERKMGGSALGETELQGRREREIGRSALGETELQRGRERDRDGRERIRRDKATEMERKRERWEGAH